ncbi:hypothetical protein AMAG_19942 [Allomyces macrogynus ATCC 38327]|uniref:Uncharacterized protein n=1 Tax=Allomyces macrogynus (strain ATCC 38327) TaxID=578462 RepID=A0A0L0T2F6_ALLM3|nr:hypothetical protein AMAG_19942 [Allomyces macrogynus ATCC 38327]|eukprot:KNE69008.1 hypothetical protein AMAG_19942 [Allomyces macrogynus ATCC 38327]
MTQVGRYAGSGQRHDPVCIDFTPTRFAFGYESGHLRLALCNPSGPEFRQVDVTLPDALTRIAWATDSGSPDTLVAATRRNMVVWVHVPKRKRAVMAMSPPLAPHPSSAIVAIAATESAQTVVATSDQLYVLGTLWLWTVDPHLAPTPVPADPATMTTTADAPPPAPGARTPFQPDQRISLSRALHGHVSPITALYMDAARILSAAASGWVRLWDPVAGTCLKRTLARSRANPTPDDRIIGVSVAPAVGGAVPPRLFIAFASGLVRTLEKRVRRRVHAGKGGAQNANGATAGAPASPMRRLSPNRLRTCPVTSS